LSPGLDDLWIEEAADIRSFAEMTANGERSILSLREWSDSNSDWDKAVDGGALGPLTVKALFRHILSPSDHHLRQLVSLWRSLA
jgi:hypothetical protein